MTAEEVVKNENGEVKDRVNQGIEKINDAITRERIGNLHPEFQQDVINFVVASQDIYPDMTIRVSSGFRSYEEQEVLYKQGRTTPGSIVTNGKAGQSYHNYGLAIDIVFIKNGKAIWDHPEYYEQIADVCNEYNLEWGGTWTNFPDYPHFQNTMGMSTSELKVKLENKKVDSNGYVIIEED